MYILSFKVALFCVSGVTIRNYVGAGTSSEKLKM